MSAMGQKLTIRTVRKVALSHRWPESVLAVIDARENQRFLGETNYSVRKNSKASAEADMSGVWL